MAVPGGHFTEAMLLLYTVAILLCLTDPVRKLSYTIGLIHLTLLRVSVLLKDC